MRATILGAVAGVVLLQTRAALPAVLWLALLLLLAVLLLTWLRRAVPGSALDLMLARGAGAVAVGVRCSAGVVLGFAWAGLFAQYNLSDALDPALEGQEILVTGIVDSLPVLADHGLRFNLQVEQALLDGRAVQVPAHIALGWYAAAPGRSGRGAAPAAVGAVEPGARWQLLVRLQRPHGNANPDGFDYEVWLLEQHLRATGQVRANAASVGLNRQMSAFVPRFATVVERTRAMVRAKILAALPESPYAGVLVALVIGDQRAIPQADWTVFNRTGIGHLVSISGLHITMIAGLFATLMHFFWRRSFFTGANLPLWLPAQKAAALTAAVTALLYVLLAGFGVPAQRTLYMLWVVAAALWCGRLGSISHVLCLAAAVVLLLDPWAVLWPGFWLSFGAVAIILYAAAGRLPEPVGPTRRARLLGQLRAGAHVQYIVTLGLVPLTLLLFGQVSLVSPLANAVAIPLVSILVAPLALAGSVLPAPLSVLLLQAAHGLFAALATFLGWLSSLPAAVWSAPLPAFWMFGGALVGALWLLAPHGWPGRWLGACAWLPLLCNQPSAPAPGAMTVTAFDVGQGMALLIETAHHRLLYDTGPMYGPGSDGANRVVLPYLKARGINHLDGVIVSHSDNDHSGGALSLLAAIPVDWVASSLPDDSPIAAAAPGHRHCIAGQRWEWDGIDFEILHPDAASYDNPKWKPNARSCTLKLTQASASMLLPADIEAPQERALVANAPERLQATVLLAPHHGSGTSSTLAFLQAVRPQVAVFQLGYRNRYHHPRPDVYARYGELGIERVRNDTAGAITLQFASSLTIGEYRRQHARYWYGH